MVNNLLAMQETWVQSRGGEETLEKEMATHSSILAWRFPWTEEPGGHSPWGGTELDMTEQAPMQTVAHQAPLSMGFSRQE